MSAKKVLKALFSEADVCVGGNRPQDITVHNENFYERVLREYTLGLGDSYVEGWWDAKNLERFIARLLRVGARKKVQEIVWDQAWKRPSTVVRLAPFRLKHYFLNRQNKNRAEDSIHSHYDLSMPLYEAMFGYDGSNPAAMTYSCGYWENLSDIRADLVGQAQREKLDLICRKLGLECGDEVLDIGCGFGSFAHYAAREYGASVTGITLSKKQWEYGRNLCRGMSNVSIRYRDYRHLPTLNKKFDHIVSVGMFEHVGPKNYRKFFEIAREMLKEDGLFLLQTIGEKETAEVPDPWISTRIFPEGKIPSLKQIHEAAEGLFVTEDNCNIGYNYALTIRAWYENFRSAWPKLQASEDFDEEFFRKWEYYLLSCAAAFRARELQLYQLVLSPEGAEGGYRWVR